MLPYALTLVSLLLFGVSDFLYKVAHDGTLHEGSYLCVQSGVVFCALGLISVGGAGWALTPATVGLGLGCGLLAFTTAITFLIAIGRGPASVTSAIRRLSFLLTGLLAVAFLGERLTAGKLGALGLAVAGLLLMRWAPQQQHRPHPIVFVAVVSSGLLSFGHKLGAIAGVSPSAFLMFQAGTVHLGAHVWCRRTGGYAFSPSVRRFAPLTGVILAVAMVLLMIALRRGEAVVLVPLAQLSFLVTAPLSVWLLHERIAPRRLFGLLLGAAAVLGFGLVA